MQSCKICPAGYYCVSGTHTPTACSPGTFNQYTNMQKAADCLACIAGQACTKHGLAKPDYPCDPGHYCPGGNRLPTENPCPAGTFTDFKNLTAMSQCETCRSTKACLEGTGGLQKPPVPCGQGHFCPDGTASPTQYPCPAGTYTNLTNLYKVEQCTICPRGWYCLEGSATPTGMCDKGHWCPDGKKKAFTIDFEFILYPSFVSAQILIPKILYLCTYKKFFYHFILTFFEIKDLGHHVFILCFHYLYSYLKTVKVKVQR